jgi:hypothetical protein
MTYTPPPPALSPPLPTVAQPAGRDNAAVFGWIANVIVVPNIIGLSVRNGTR